MLSYSEFSLGIISLLPISKIILEKMFGLIDVNQIGMVDFDKFGWWRDDGAVKFPWTNEWDSKVAAYYRVVDISE